MKRTLLLLAAALSFASHSFAQNTAAPNPPAASAKTADEQWALIEKLQQGPSEQPKSEEEMKATVKKFVGELRGALLSFNESFPNDPRKWKAKLMLADLVQMEASLSEKEPDVAELRKQYEAIASAEDAPADTRAIARLNLIGVALMEADESSSPEAVAKVDGMIDAFVADFPDHQVAEPLRMRQATLLMASNPEKAKKLLTKLGKSGDQQMQMLSSGLLSQMELMGKPLELEFTSVRGDKVSLAALRGKVVLLDFWATWCGPCVQEIPNVVATYNELHGKGFEIVGLSMDEDKDALLAFIKEHKMPWPQRFDGKGMEGEFAQKYGVNAIPAMWLLDREGKIASLNARGDLKGMVEKLLAQ